MKTVNTPEFFANPALRWEWQEYRRKMDCWIPQREWYYTQYLTRLCIELESKIMANKTTKKPATQKAKQSWEVTFVNVQFTAADRTDLQSYPMTPDEQMDFIASYVESGYKQSWSYNPANGNHTFTLTCRDDGHPNNGLAVSSWGKTYFQAIKGLVYKIDQKLPEFWNEYQASDSDDIG